MSNYLPATPVMDRVNAILSGEKSGFFGAFDHLQGAYESNYSLSDLGILETVRAYLRGVPATARMYGDHLGWITAGEYIGRVEKAVGAIAQCYDGLSEWAAAVYLENNRGEISAPELEAIANSYDLSIADIIGLLKHGRYIVQTKGPDYVII